MNIEIIGDDRRNAWEEFVYSNPKTIAWHSYTFNELLRKHYAVDFLPIAALNGSKIVGILPLYKLRTHLSKDKLISVPYFVAGGIAADDDAVRLALLDKAIALSKQYGSCPIALKQYKYKMPGQLQSDENFYNGELDLTRNLEDILAHFDERNRVQIEKAEDVSLRLEYPSTDIDAFYKMLFNHNHKKGVPGVSKQWIEDIYHFGMYHIALLKKGDRIVAATMAKEYKKTVSFPHSCAIDMGPENVKYMYNLYWKLIQHFKAHDFEIFHSGRIPNTNETEEYRLGWGGVKHQYYYQYYPVGDTVTEFKKKRGWKRDVFSYCWKKMPAFLVKAIGPVIYNQFP